MQYLPSITQYDVNYMTNLTMSYYISTFSIRMDNVTVRSQWCTIQIRADGLLDMSILPVILQHRSILAIKYDCVYELYLYLMEYFKMIHTLRETGTIIDLSSS